MRAAGSNPAALFLWEISSPALATICLTPFQFQTVDGNPVVQGRTNRTDSAFLYNPAGTTLTNQPRRVDLTRGVERLRCNCAQSIYHSLQVSLDKRLSQNFSAGVHYTWSAFIDTASEIFNP